MRIVCPRANAARWVPAPVSAFSKFGLSDDRRRAAAMGQFLVEAGSALNETVENLHYSADRACQVFPALFSTPQAAEPYCLDPQRFADTVYAGVNGNGDAASGDGYRFRGRGLIQLTGRNEYAAFGQAIGKTAERRRPSSARGRTARLLPDAGIWRPTAACGSPMRGTSTRSPAGSTARPWKPPAPGANIRTRC
jgi:predicted chitinase